MPSSPRCVVRIVVVWIVSLVSLLVFSSQLRAQSWAGQGRLSGVVLDQDEQPIEGAEVRLVLGDQGGPATIRTDRKGHWSRLGLAQGSWDLEISADGFVQTDGFVTVGPGPSEPQRVVMRPLSQTTGRFAEQASSVLDWITKGNSLLEQGQAAEARAEYEKALPYLVEEKRPDLLRAVARTYAAERNLDGAVTALRQALIYSPEDTETRQLFTSLLTAFDRGDEADAWLARLDTEGADTLREELGIQQETRILAPTHQPLPVDRPVVGPEPHRIGFYRLRSTDASPLATLDTFLKRTGADREQIEAIDAKAGALDLAHETFEVFVPETYEPGQKGWGLFVWVSPTNFGGLQRLDNLATLAEKKLIWIGANHSGNYRKVWDRALLALDAAYALMPLYDLESGRVYVGGYSGGGRMATWLSMLYPEVFQGGYFVKGVDFYKDVAMPDRPGAHWPAAFDEPPRSTWPQIKERNRYVFFTGENDFNRLQTKTFHRLYQEDGFKNVFYIEEPGADHYSAFDGEYLGRAIDLLDGK